MQCARCGYGLVGVPLEQGAAADGAVMVTCPECGVRQSLWTFAPRPLGPWWRTTWRLSRPAVCLCTACAALVVCTAFRPLSAMFAMQLAFAMAAAFVAGWVGPFFEGPRLAAGTLPPGPQREALARRLIAIGLGVNLLVGVAYVALGVWLAGVIGVLG